MKRHSDCFSFRRSPEIHDALGSRLVHPRRYVYGVVTACLSLLNTSPPDSFSKADPEHARHHARCMSQAWMMQCSGQSPFSISAVHALTQFPDAIISMLSLVSAFTSASESLNPNCDSKKKIRLCHVENVIIGSRLLKKLCVG